MQIQDGSGRDAEAEAESSEASTRERLRRAGDNKMPRKPIWTEGLLVSQHHFQQQDQYIETLLSRTARKPSRTTTGGVTDLKIDERGFAAGQFRTPAIDREWPDGTSIACG